MEKALLIFSILFGIIGLQVSTQAVDYENFVFKGTECYTERQDEEQAEAAYESARQKVMKLIVKRKTLQFKMVFGGLRGTGKTMQQLQQTEEDLDAAERDALNKYSDWQDAEERLINCIDSLLCGGGCGSRTDHLSPSCSTCDATNFYSCQHRCPGIPTCDRSGCNAQLDFNVTRALHTQVRCSGCKNLYWRCDMHAVEIHRPRTCLRIVNEYSLSSSDRYICGASYRDCINYRLSCASFAGRHNDFGAGNGACPLCNGPGCSACENP